MDIKQRYVSIFGNPVHEYETASPEEYTRRFKRCSLYSEQPVRYAAHTSQFVISNPPNLHKNKNED